MTNKIIFSLLFTLSGCSTVDKALRHPFTDYYRIRTDIANVRDSPNSDVLETPVMAMGAGVFIAVKNTGNTLVFFQGQQPLSDSWGGDDVLVNFTRANYEKERKPIQDFIDFMDSGRKDYGDFNVELSSKYGDYDGVFDYDRVLLSKYIIREVTVNPYSDKNKHNEMNLLIFYSVPEIKQPYILHGHINDEQAKQILKISDDWYNHQLNLNNNKIFFKCGITCYDDPDELPWYRNYLP
ncbi:hypothetical protein GFI10_24065 [Salmonella enterica subsp. diarizonae]|uniref:Lipoprotein n=1 Tax=Salmonella enterica TaxID=28901 RepID=A0A743P9S0_SALER|nr:hypothetical protein [Salmonella enterica subsp. diarizonae]HAF2131110.1 hypothetical protein [Salmonella enterica]